MVQYIQWYALLPDHSVLAYESVGAWAWLLNDWAIFTP